MEPKVKVATLIIPKEGSYHERKRIKYKKIDKPFVNRSGVQTKLAPVTTKSKVAK